MVFLSILKLMSREYVQINLNDTYRLTVNHISQTINEGYSSMTENSVLFAATQCEITKSCTKLCELSGVFITVDPHWLYYGFSQYC
jgi:hypothetical protein